jgi:hypothetical protein
MNLPRPESELNPVCYRTQKHPSTLRNPESLLYSTHGAGTAIPVGDVYASVDLTDRNRGLCLVYVWGSGHRFGRRGTALTQRRKLQLQVHA